MNSKKYTAFSVPGLGLFQFMRMLFGLNNAPITFQRLIDALFKPEFEPVVFGYLDDIIIVTDSYDEHLRWLRIVIRKLAIAGLVVNLEKCEFGCSRVLVTFWIMGLVYDQTQEK